MESNFTECFTDLREVRALKLEDFPEFPDLQNIGNDLLIRRNSENSSKGEQIIMVLENSFNHWQGCQFYHSHGNSWHGK